MNRYATPSFSVERGDRLIADDELRVDGEGAGNADALPLAAGKFMGVVAGMLGVQADIVHQLKDLFPALFFVGVEMVDVQRLTDDVLDGHTRVERGIGVLEDHLHLLAVRQHVDMDALFADGLSRRVEQWLPCFVIALAAVEQDVAAKRDAPGGRHVELHERAADGRLTAAGCEIIRLIWFIGRN